MEIENIRQQIAKQVGTSLNDFLDTSTDDIGYLNNFYVGKVVNNNDPEKLGRCRVRVFGVFESEVPDNQLPWAMPDFDFIGSKKGSFIVPPIDAIVRVYFDKADINLPHYTDKITDKNNLSTQKDTNYPNNMVFFETDDGEYFTINRTTKQTTYHHSSGAEIKIDRIGNITIKPKVATTVKFDSNLTVVSPDQTKFGPYCALPFCLYTGSPHQGNTILKTS